MPRKNAFNEISHMHSLPACRNEIGIFGNVGFREGGEPENEEKNPCARLSTNNKLNSRMFSGSKNRTCAIFVELTGN